MKRQTKSQKLVSQYFRDMAGKAMLARMAKISPERRSEIARNAVNARWDRARERAKSWHRCIFCNIAIPPAHVCIFRDGGWESVASSLINDAKVACQVCARKVNARWAKKKEKDDELRSGSQKIMR